ncbi:MAG TPA: hypothetical protein VIJ55_10560 [Acetobacteraceae bacterium]
MTLTASMAGGLSGAFMLARGRAEGFARVQTDMAGAARSFWAAAIALPALLAMRLIDWAVQGRPATPGHALALEFLVFLVGWSGYAVVSRGLVAAMGRAARWPGYIAVWNWCNVVQYVLLLAASIPVLLRAPAPVQEVSELVALGWALWLEWFATRIALDVPWVAAAGLVALDMSIGLLLSGIAGI